jgi:4-hydroxythreonine-4-phosphate dehydrogenase
MSHLLIIADDLSGAADCASAYAKAGREALVMIDPDAPGDVGTADVVALDADSRRMPATKAAQLHRALHARYAVPGQAFYRKIDSTLRGNFAAEVAAVSGAAGLAIVAPAFPPAGRTTRNGRQYLNGVALEDTEIWRSEGLCGVAHLPTMLERHGMTSALLGLADIRCGAGGLAAHLEAAARTGLQAIVCDAETEDDLRALAQASRRVSAACFWVGSAGLAIHLAQVDGASAAQPAKVAVNGAILTVVGSLSGVSRAQAERLQRATGMHRIAIPAGMLRQGASNPYWASLQQTLSATLGQGNDLLLTIGVDDTVDMDEGLHLCRGLARLLAPLAGLLGALVSTGGETARALLCAMHYRTLRLAGEIEPGVPLSIAVGPRPLPVITKAGAFGSRDTLLHCHATLLEARNGASIPTFHTKGS